MSAEAIATSLRAAQMELGEVKETSFQVSDALKRIGDAIEWADALAEAALKPAAEAVADPTPAPADPSRDAVDKALRDYVAFGAEVGGTCLGLAMSTNHPDPDTALMGLFRKSQELASSTSALLTKKVSSP